MSDLEWPPYSYVPGRWPHPSRDPRGHSFGQHEQPAVWDAADPWQSADFLAACRLFDAGYYWEAHEQWEGLWHAAGRTTPRGRAVQGLIKLAAAGVKAREGNANGVGRHATRALQLLREAGAQELRDGGIRWDAAVRLAEMLAEHPDRFVDTDPVPVKAILPLTLLAQSAACPEEEPD